jgi:ribosome biogenesis GTPase / thiamine phosphate phosphatase
MKPDNEPKIMNLEYLGFTSKLEKHIAENNLQNFEIGRITTEHKERYVVSTAKGEFEAEITGNMRYSAVSREDFPAVGDWVALMVYDPDFAIIHQILPRYSVIKRQASGQSSEIQIIASNVDFAFILQSVDRDFSINRLERYLTICYAGKVSPVIVLTKTDLIPPEMVLALSERIKTRIENVPVLAISNETEEGYETLSALIGKSLTCCLLGSSGVGKSTLINHLSGKHLMETDSISEHTQRGRHITSHRELFVLENGGILIDNPGMREVGISDAPGGLEVTFSAIAELGRQCRYKDCTHTHETGCSVIEAVEKGELDRASYDNYLKMERERAYFETTTEERRRKEKIFGKILKDYQKNESKEKRR